MYTRVRGIGRGTPRSFGVAIVLALSLGIVACAPAAETTESTTPSTSTAAPTTSSTPEILTIGPAEKPPVLFDGDCANMLSDEQISDVVGVELSLYDSSGDSLSMANTGGLNCYWQGESGDVHISASPTSQINGTDLSAEMRDTYFGSCSSDVSNCGSEWESEELWISLGFNLLPDMANGGVEAWSSELGEEIQARYEKQPTEAWMQDRTGWWQNEDCADLSTSISADAGVDIDVEEYGYIDYPRAGFFLQDKELGVTDCRAGLAAGSSTEVDITFRATPGAAWNINPDELREVDSDVEGIAVYQSADSENEFVLTDQVNVVTLSAYVGADGPFSAESFAIALAGALAQTWG